MADGDSVPRTPVSVLREWLNRYDNAVRYLASDGTNVGGRAHYITERDRYGALIKADGLHDALAHCDDLLAALAVLLDRYTSLVNCGDCGNWDPEEETAVIVARAAIAKAVS